MFQSIRDFKTCYALVIKYISTSKKALKLLLNIQVSLSLNKIQLLQKQPFVNLLKIQTKNAIYFLYFTYSL